MSRRKKQPDLEAKPCILGVVERKERLSEIAVKEDARDRDAIASIDTLNRMDRLYAEPLAQGNSFTFNVLIAGKEGRELVNRLLAGDRKELPTSQGG